MHYILLHTSRTYCYARWENRGIFLEMQQHYGIIFTMFFLVLMSATRLHRKLEILKKFQDDCQETADLT